jgi:hypothetical protein
MKNLETLQSAFFQSLFSSSSTAHESFASSHSDQRLKIYKQTVIDTLGNALALTYPGLWKLLGEECANQLAYAFCEHNKNLPTTGCLDDWGAEFPDFISQQSSLLHLPYLKDYGNYEWLKHQSFCASHSPSMSLSDFEAIPPSSIESLQFIFHPSVQTFCSNYPLNKIKELIENFELNAVDLNSNKTFCLITRPENELIHYWIEADCWLLIRSLQQSLRLGEAVQKTMEQHPNFKLSSALHFIIQTKIVSGIK